jgi:hypothetical protein
VTVADAELAEAPDLLARTSVARRVTAALAAGALTLPELAAVAASEATVGRAVRRLREQGRVVLVDNAQPWRWELASRSGAWVRAPDRPRPVRRPGHPDRTSGS